MFVLFWGDKAAEPYPYFMFLRMRFCTVLFCIALRSSQQGKRELVAVLAVCLCVQCPRFVVSRFTYFSDRARGKLRSLIVALPGGLFILSFVSGLCIRQ